MIPNHVTGVYCNETKRAQEDNKVLLTTKRVHLLGILKASVWLWKRCVLYNQSEDTTCFKCDWWQDGSRWCDCSLLWQKKCVQEDTKVTLTSELVTLLRILKALVWLWRVCTRIQINLTNGWRIMGIFPKHQPAVKTWQGGIWYITREDEDRDVMTEDEPGHSRER